MLGNSEFQNLTKSHSHISQRIIFSIILASAILIRIYYSLTTPIFEADGAIALLTGRVFDKSGIISIEGPFASVLNGSLYKIFGESILIAKLVDTVASIGIILLCYFFALKAYNKRTALLTAFFIAFSPLNILFSIMAKPYMVLSFLITLSACLFFIGVRTGKYYPVVLGGLCVPLAFGFRTFSIFSLLGMLVMSAILFLRMRNKKEKDTASFWYPLIFIASAIVFLSPILIWRISKLGIYFFRDFGMPEWLKSQDFAYIQKWQNVEHHYLDSPYLFFPAFLLFASVMFRKREKITANLISFCYAFSFIFLLIINPGHHFPRILVPAIPFLSIMSAYLIDYFLNNPGKVSSFSLLTTLTFSPWLYILIKFAGPFGTEVSSTKGVIKMITFISVSFSITLLLSYITALNIDLKRTRSGLIFIVMIVTIFAADGLRQSDKQINILSKSIMPYTAAIEFAPPSGTAKGILYENNPSGMLEGKDSLDLRDLPLKEGLELISGNYEPVSKKHGLSYFIMPMYRYADGIYFTYRDMNIRFLKKEPKMHEELLASDHLDRIYDNASIIILQNPAIRLTEKPGQYSDRAIPVKAFAGNRGDDFLEACFRNQGREMEYNYVLADIRNRTQNRMELKYTVSLMNGVIEAESFYSTGKNNNPWVSAYSHWSEGTPYMRDYFSNNTAMIFPISNKSGEGTLYRKLQLDEACYSVYARISLPKIDKGEIHLNFSFDGKPLCSFDSGFREPEFKYCFLGEINLTKGKENMFDIKASGKTDGKEAYIIFDRLVFIRKGYSEIRPEKITSIADSLPWEFSRGTIILSSGETKTIKIPKNYSLTGRLEFLAYSPSSNISYLLYRNQQLK